MSEPPSNVSPSSPEAPKPAVARGEPGDGALGDSAPGGEAQNDAAQGDSNSPASGLRFEPPAGSVLRLPSFCANCAGAAGASARLKPAWGVKGRAILVPYCARCAGRLAQYHTRRAVSFGASFLVGLISLLGLPLLATPLSMFTYGAIVTLAAAVPPLIAEFLTRKRVPEAGQTSAEMALWWERAGISGTNSRWMREFAALNRSASTGEPTRGAEPLTARRPREWYGAVLPITFAAVSPSFFQWLFPTLVVLNLSSSEFELVIDGRVRRVIGVTSLESTSAAIRVALGAGSHVLEARPRGAGVDAETPTYHATVSIEAGEEYLFAPGSDGYCFWLERTAYGGTDSKSRTQPLGGKDGFFRLPSPIDTWFGANPAPNGDRVSTGGEMVALRQGRCQ